MDLRQPEPDPSATPPPAPLAPRPSAFSAGLPVHGDVVPTSLSAFSGFIKRSTCVRCGAPKTLPSSTAYLYCDYCGSLVDYDFRLANAGTNAGITNTIYARIVDPCRPDMERAKATGNYDEYRRVMRYVYSRWIDECPQAMSPRVRTDADFRDRMVAYCVESTVCKDMDPVQQQMDAQMNALIAGLQRIPQPGGAWLFAGDFWTMAAHWKEQMRLAYAAMDHHGITALDPDDPPPGVAVKMEHSASCQAWLPHLSAEDGKRLLDEFGLSGDYVQPKQQTIEHHRCGGCGAELQTVVGARVVVCEQCGRQIDIQTGAAPCRTCGAPLNFPVAQARLNCPYCQAETQRV